jgi:voltage-gated potassium channel
VNDGAGQPPTAGKPASVRRRGNAYSIFIAVLTVQSLAIMVLILLPLSGPINDTLIAWDTVICVIFLIDFAMNVARSHPKSDYLVRRLGWLDLIGSIPTFGIYRLIVLLRLARVARLVRLSRQIGRQGRRELINDVVRNRGQYALFITMLLAFIVITSASVLILMFESKAPDANITTGGDAVWWAIVTITTVGYGDHFPVTGLGRGVAIVVMFSGIGIIGALASILASLLVSPRAEDTTAAVADLTSDQQAAQTRDALVAFADHPAAESVGNVVAALAETRNELARTRDELAQVRLMVGALHETSTPSAPADRTASLRTDGGG